MLLCVVILNDDDVVVVVEYIYLGANSIIWLMIKSRSGFRSLESLKTHKQKLKTKQNISLLTYIK